MVTAPRSVQSRLRIEEQASKRGRGWMNDQIVELDAPGLQLILYAPQALRDLEDGRNYGAKFPDGRDLVDYVNECRVAALTTRFPQREHLLHFSSTFDNSVIARASDHVILGLNVVGHCLCVRSGDDLFRWQGHCPDEQLLSADDGNYSVTACMLPPAADGPIRIYFHFIRVPARADLGYARLPELYAAAPVC